MSRTSKDVVWKDGKPFVLAEGGVREPICWCGDWKHSHENGKGKCLTCHHMSEPAGGCTEYRYSGTSEIRKYDPKLDGDLFGKRED